MDAEKSSNSSFEDLSNVNVNDLKNPDDEDELVDILGNGQLTKRILRKGQPDSRPERLDICTINYIGKLDDGTIVEDEKNFIMQIGDLEVVQGLDMAIPLMDLGEKAEIITDARFAYGIVGLVNEKNPELSIPPDARITYTLELLSHKLEKDLENKSFNSRKQIGNRKRERGNFWFERKEYNLAIQSYRRALEYLDDTEGGITDPTANGELAPTNAQLQDLLEDRIKTYNNLAMAQMKISAFDTALKSVENVLQCQPNNVKALFRKGKILEAQNELSAAIPLLQKAAMLEPDDKAIQTELSKLILKSKREARNEKDLYQKMLGHAQKLEQKNATKKQANGNNDSSKFKHWGFLLGSILIAVAGIGFYRYKYF